MGPHGRLKECDHNSPSCTVREAMATARRYLEQGATEQEQAQARAALETPRCPRQPTLPLRVQP